MIRDEKVIRIDIFGELQALGASYHSGFAVQLENIDRSNINGEAMRLLHNNVKQQYSGTNGANTYEILEQGSGNAVIMISQDLWQHVSSICQYFRSEVGCDQATSFNFEASIPLITPVSLADMPLAPYDPFIFGTEGLYHGDSFSYQPGRELEIHLPDKAPTAKFNNAYFGVADDTSDPSQGRYFRNLNNLPWALEVTQEWQWPSERKTILQAFPKFQQFAESKGKSATNWFDSSESNSQYLFH